MKFSINNTTYAYEISGEGPPVLLLHGFTGSQRTWTPLRKRLEKQFQVITVDLPGHGQTVASTKSIEQCCHDVAQLLKFLQVEQAHILGYSMGGRVALSFAILYPNYVSSLLLESASPGIEKVNERNDRMKQDEQLAQKIEQKGLTWFVDFWENIPLFETQKHLPHHIQQNIREERLSQRELELAESLRNMGTGTQPSWWHKLTNIPFPVLLIVGELDSKFIHINQRMEQQIEQAEVMTVRAAGHAIHVEQPEKFAKLVVSFLQKQNQSS